MLKQALLSASILSVSFISVQSVLAFPINVNITADNAYGFGFGNATGISTYCGGIRNILAGEIFSPPVTNVSCNGIPFPYTIPNSGPERYSLDVNSTDYVYMVAWSDNSVSQGILASFELSNNALVSGSNTWEVFATGIDKNSSLANDTLTVADLPSINQQITLANNNSGASNTSSVGWVGINGGSSGTIGALALGGLNINGQGLSSYPFQVQGIASDARWMWYDANPADNNNPFSGASEREYLIFRTQIQSIVPSVPEPSNLTGLCLILLTGMSKIILEFIKNLK